jgi:hypothetical protein
MSLKKAHYVPSVHWEILRLDSKHAIGLSFEHNEPVTSDVFHGLTLRQAQQLISDLQIHVDYLNALRRD